MIDRNKIQSFEQLPVWQDALEFAADIYKLTTKFPADEKFAMTSQIRRAAYSISANIAEGFGRKSVKEKIQFYRIAYGSLLEVKNFAYLANKLGYINDEYNKLILSSADSLLKQINAIIAKLSS